MRQLRNRRGQSTVEYAILFAVIIAGLLTMQSYVKRGVQGRLRGASDEIGEQFSPGSLNGSLTTTLTKTTTENKTTAGAHSTAFSGVSQLTTGTVNMTTALADDPDATDSTTPATPVVPVPPADPVPPVN